MNFIEFHNKFKNQILISKKEILLNFPSFDNKNLTYWQKKGYIKKVINWFYVFSDLDLEFQKLYFISNNVYFPNYIWTFQALNFYSLIPEQVFQITAVSTNKTNTFTFSWIKFSYQKISKKLFWWYKSIKFWEYSFYISDLEKTILDFFYLNKQYKTENDIIELRFNFDVLKEQLDEKKLLKYLKIFNNKPLEKKIFIFLTLLKNA
jgi:predicted transcriptional regulator of viral defense system